MSRYFSKKYDLLEAYTPGEQPRNREYIKLNTNESPFPPSESVICAVEEESRNLQLYSDPECTELNKIAAEFFGVKPGQILMTNGSDEILNFAFMAFGDSEHPFVFPDITYGFYPVFANVNRIPFETISLKDDFSIDINDYMNINKNIVIANPNAPTGIALSLSEIESIVRSNSDNVIIIDEAYIDFGGESSISLINKYDNIIVTRTFSKSYSLAGARLGFCIANESLIADLNTIKYSTNPYNINRMTMAAGTAALNDAAYYMKNCEEIIKTREYTKEKLINFGFTVTESKTNFLFAKNSGISGERLYKMLKEKGILIRHFNAPKIKEYNRITVGTKEQMDVLLSATESILKEVYEK